MTPLNQLIFSYFLDQFFIRREIIPVSLEDCLTILVLIQYLGKDLIF